SHAGGSAGAGHAVRWRHSARRGRFHLVDAEQGVHGAAPSEARIPNRGRGRPQSRPLPPPRPSLRPHDLAPQPVTLGLDKNLEPLGSLAAMMAGSTAAGLVAFLTVMGCALTALPKADAHSPGVVLSGSGSPSIDGVLTPGEWDRAATVNFAVSLPA